MKRQHPEDDTTETPMILGIDPGGTGGAAILDPVSWNIVTGMRMPVFKVRSKTVIDANALLDFTTLWKLDTAIIEGVHAMPGQGVSSCFSFGRSTGAAEAVAMIAADKIEWVTPQSWKKHFGLSKEKQASLDLARLRFGSAFHWTKKADDGIAEAALIALYWLEKRQRSMAA